MRKDLQCFRKLEPGQVRAKAVVDAPTEGQDRRRRFAGDVEAVGIVVDGGITVGRKGIHEDERAGGEGVSADLDVFSHSAECASLYVNGIDPGYSGDTEVHAALSLVTRARSITVQEIFDYGNYDEYEFTGKSMGFGMTADDETPMLFLPGVITSMWGGPVRNLADQLGVELDEIRQRTEPWYTQSRIECKMTTVEPGQMAAARFAVEGVRDGVAVITMEHINRFTPAAAPDWEYPPDNQVGVHRVVVEGDPRVELNTHVSDPVLDSTDAGCISTAARVVDAIDWICRAPKGLIAVEDIPQAEVIRGLMW